MRRALIAASFLGVTALGLAQAGPAGADNLSIGVQSSAVNLGITLGPTPPPLVVLPGPVVAGPPPPPVYIAPHVPYNYFAYTKYHYLYHDGRWLRARRHDGPWTVIAIAQVPGPILAVPVERYPGPPHPLGAPGAAPMETRARPRAAPGARAGARPRSGRQLPRPRARKGAQVARGHPRGRPVRRPAHASRRGLAGFDLHSFVHGRRCSCGCPASCFPPPPCTSPRPRLDHAPTMGRSRRAGWTLSSGPRFPITCGCPDLSPSTCQTTGTHSVQAHNRSASGSTWPPARRCLSPRSLPCYPPGIPPGTVPTPRAGGADVGSRRRRGPNL